MKRILGDQMLDLLYVVMTVDFFVAMLGYTSACERLGRRMGDSKDKT